MDLNHRAAARDVSLRALAPSPVLLPTPRSLGSQAVTGGCPGSMWPIAPLLPCSCLPPAHPLHVSLRSCLWGLLEAGRPEGARAGPRRSSAAGRQPTLPSYPSRTARAEEAGGGLSSGPPLGRHRLMDAGPQCPQQGAGWPCCSPARVPHLCPGPSHNKALPLQGGRGRGCAEEPEEG